MSDLDIIKKSFAVQAENFENKNMSFVKQEYLDNVIKEIDFSEKDSVLDVASGTCICGRAIAKKVKKVVCLDATKEMLDKGRELAEKDGIENISFRVGRSEQLPYKDGVFDVVFTRLSFHHYKSINLPFFEMCRVLKKGGKLILIDMEATREELRLVQDKIETLRDPSHVKNRSREELELLFKNNNIEIVKSELTQIPVELKTWMELTKTPEDTQNVIIKLMENEFMGGMQTGFFPFKRYNEIYFNQRWLFLMGKK